MNLGKRIGFGIGLLLTGLLWAVLLDRLISFGPPTPNSYNMSHQYDGSKLCDLVKPRMDRQQVAALIRSLGKPNATSYVNSTAKDIESLQAVRRSYREPAGTPVASDMAGGASQPDWLVYPHNLWFVGSSESSCEIQMDPDGQKVIYTSRSRPFDGLYQFK
jgi:hypothetical protein